MRYSASYVLGFCAVVCVVCAVLVSGAAVSLREAQEINASAFRQQNVLAAAGRLEPGERIDQAELERRFDGVVPVVIDLATGDALPDIDPTGFDQRKATTDPSTSRLAPSNNAQIQRLPNQVLVYEVRDASGAIEMVILPIEGKGLWSTLYGFLALEGDLRTIAGITFYDHKETAGLGGEVDNPRWKALWPGRKAFDDSGEPAITVIKGPTGPPSEAPYRIDGLSGATMTSRGVSNLVQFWLGSDGVGPYLDRLREER